MLGKAASSSGTAPSVLVSGRRISSRVSAPAGSFRCQPASSPPVRRRSVMPAPINRTIAVYAPGAESVEVIDVVASEFDVLQTIAVAQGVGGEVEHMIGFGIEETNLENFEASVDGVDEADVACQFVKKRDAAIAQTMDPFGNLIAEIAAGQDRAGLLFARHVLSLGDGSSLRAVVNGTARLGQGVRRETESEGSRCQNSDSTNRNRIQGRPRRVTRQWTRRPKIHPEA